MSSDDGGGVLEAFEKLKPAKKKTDNRRPKGRRLSYEPMPKLQNFMFPGSSSARSNSELAAKLGGRIAPTTAEMMCSRAAAFVLPTKGRAGGAS